MIVTLANLSHASVLDVILLVDGDIALWHTPCYRHGHQICDVFEHFSLLQSSHPIPICSCARLNKQIEPIRYRLGLDEVHASDPPMYAHTHSASFELPCSDLKARDEHPSCSCLTRQSLAMSNKMTTKPLSCASRETTQNHHYPVSSLSHCNRGSS